jgi:hypothetical protein
MLDRPARLAVPRIADWHHRDARRHAGSGPSRSSTPIPATSIALRDLRLRFHPPRDLADVARAVERQPEVA